MAEGVQGRLLWYQLNTPDPEKGLEFYRGLTGWGLETFQPEGSPPYRMITRGGMPVGGAMELPPEAAAAGAPPHWLVYIGADDVDATFAKAVAAGARSHVPPCDIPEVGRFAVLADPWGAIFAIYAPGSQPPPEGPCVDGDFSWHEISADDLEKSWSFYQDLFGWEVRSEFDMGPEMGPYRMFGRPGHDRLIGGMYKRAAEMPVNIWGIYVQVPSVAEGLEKAEKKGAKVVFPVMEVPGGDLIVGLTDPQGAYFSLHQKNAGKEDCPAES
jgi:predicted enzyme related to lactoylglutathione lyase